MDEAERCWVVPESMRGDEPHVYCVTVYKEDPERTRFAEWHELWYYYDDQSEAFILVQKHGWDDIKRLNTEVLAEPHKTEEKVRAAMDATVQRLVNEGWIYKYPSLFKSFF